MKSDDKNSNQEAMEEFDILTLVDEDGEEHEFELADSVEVDGTNYLALIPLYNDGQEYLDDNAELIVMRVAQEDNEEFLDPVEDEEEYAKISGIFTERLSDMFDFEGDE